MIAAAAQNIRIRTTTAGKVQKPSILKQERARPAARYDKSPRKALVDHFYPPE